MSAIRDAKAKIANLKQSLNSQIAMLSGQRATVEQLRGTTQSVFAQSSPGLDVSVRTQLDATLDGLGAASSQLQAAIEELDRAQAML
jgi:prefoldin subunit 5